MTTLKSLNSGRVGRDNTNNNPDTVITMVVRSNMIDSSLILVPASAGVPRKLSRLTIQVKRDNLKPFRLYHIASFP